MFNPICKLKTDTLTCIKLNKSHLKFFSLNNFSQKILVYLVIGLCSSFFFLHVEADKGDIVQVSSTKGESYRPQLMVVDNSVYLVWTDTSPGNNDIFFSKSTNGAMNFENIINLSKNNGVSFNPWIRVNENNVYIVWNDESPHLPPNIHRDAGDIDVFLGDLDILIATSHDGGSKFDVSNLSNSQGMSSNPRIAVSGNNVYVVWNEETMAGYEIFFSKSTDNGKTFSEPINVSKSDAESLDAGLPGSGGNVYIVWHESTQDTSDIFFAASDNDGLSFGLPINLSTMEGIPSLTRDTQMVASGNNIFVVWYNQNINNGIFLAKSSDGGRTFGAPINLNDFNNAEFAQIAVN